MVPPADRPRHSTESNMSVGGTPPRVSGRAWAAVGVAMALGLGGVIWLVNAGGEANGARAGAATSTNVATTPVGAAPSTTGAQVPLVTARSAEGPQPGVDVAPAESASAALATASAAPPSPPAAPAKTAPAAAAPATGAKPASKPTAAPSARLDSRD
jgi:hypothetical protein